MLLTLVIGEMFKCIIAPHPWGFLFVGGCVDLGMRRYISLLLFIGLAWGQNEDSPDVITMKTGFVYKGTIIEASMTQVIILPQFESTSLILSRRDIKHISTAVSRGNVVINESTSVSNYMYDAGEKLENYVFYTISGGLINIIGLYMMNDANNNGKSNQGGVIVIALGNIISLVGFLEIGEAGKDLKRASYKLKETKKKND